MNDLDRLFGKQIEQAPFVIAAAGAVMIAAAAFFTGRQRLEGRWKQHLDGKAGYQPCGFTTWQNVGPQALYVLISTLLD